MSTALFDLFTENNIKIVVFVALKERAAQDPSLTADERTRITAGYTEQLTKLLAERELLRSFAQNLLDTHAVAEALREESDTTKDRARESTKRVQDLDEERRRRKKAIHWQFEGWCMHQKPRVSFSLHSWDNPEIRARFETYLVEQETAKQEEDRRKRAEIEEQMRRDREESEAIRKSFEALPRSFRTFIGHYAPTCVTQRKVVESWNNEETRELYELWLAEQPQNNN